jgi:2'-5' RNA ligase
MSKKPAPKLLRCFIGIKFPLLKQIDPLLKALAQPAGDSLLKIRVTPPKNLHLTLKFLGTIEPEQEAALATVLSTVSAAHSEFQINCSGVGFFKDSIWVGITPNNQLSDLVGKLNESLAAVGLEPETKPYTPHITVARFGALAKPKLLKIANRFEAKQWGEIKVNKFHLYRSETLPEGAMYYIINKYELAAADGLGKVL